MISRTACLLVVLAAIGGCYSGPFRDLCDQDADPTCCPPGSHEVVSDVNSDLIICGPDEMPCADAGADADACHEGGTDAH